MLEIWAYLKGDVVGALEDEDLVAIGRADQAWNRVYAVLERVTESLGWDAVDDDWTTLEGTTSVNYIGTDPPDDSWLDRADGGWLYVVITNLDYRRAVRSLIPLRNSRLAATAPPRFLPARAASGDLV